MASPSAGGWWPSHLSLNRLSTGTKMLLILTAALLPLGMIALFASIQSAHSKRLQLEADTRMIATAEARQIDLLLMRGANALRTSLALDPSNSERCAELLNQNIRNFRGDVRLALFSKDGRLLCATPGFDARHLPRPRGAIGLDVLLLANPAVLRFATDGSDGAYGVGELPLDLVRAGVQRGSDKDGVILGQGSTRLDLFVPAKAYPLGQHLSVDAPVAGGQINLILTIVTNPISAVEILLVLLPLLMWMAAAVIGWVVVNQLLLRPLGQLQRAVAGFRPDQNDFSIPRMTTPSREITELGEAFRHTAEQIAARETRLEEGLQHQVRLTREVHHRVKNNLQVVASLINLHARGAEGPVAAAYASIQRRVDALAIVHRNHFAELEDNRGVAVRALVSELAANLRGTAPAAAQNLTITLDMAPGYINQDVAVPVAFLITELVELIMECDPGGGVLIELTPPDAHGRAVLSISGPGLAAERCAAHPAHTQFERVIVGLSRQLRAPLDYDPETGRYTIAITTVPEEN